MSQATVEQDLQTWNKYLKATALAKKRISIVKPKDIMNEYRLIMKNNYLTRKAFNKISCVINGLFRYACMEMDNPPIEINVARSVDVSKMTLLRSFLSMRYQSGISLTSLAKYCKY